MIHNIVVKLLKHSRNTWLSQEDRKLMQDAAEYIMAADAKVDRLEREKAASVGKIQSMVDKFTKGMEGN